MKTRRRRGVSCALSVSLACVCLASGASAQRRKPRGASAARKQYGKVCPDPTAACPTGEMTFDPYELPFRLPKNAVIFESEEFYAVILKSVRVPSADDCEKFVSESDRLAAQKLFPRRKVFASRCAEPGRVYYTNIAPAQRVLAVYAGATLEEAGRTLAEVKATGKFPGANIRRMRAGINGT